MHRPAMTLPTPAAGPHSSRRAALGGGAAGLLGLGLLSGCDLADIGGPGASSTPTGGAAPAPADDPDETLLDEVRAEVDALAALTTALQRRQPSLRATVEPLVALHAAHREALRSPDDPSPATPPPSAPAGAPAELRALLLRRERDAARRLSGWAVRAESGALARLLASMAAGVAAHLAAEQDRARQAGAGS